ncbi:MAG: tyrosine-type recombinase/integrase [Burkholderiaceae bacterium]|nr:tyrosine-type recombinase/integrase [Burkholderiaceae bacterium]
MTRYPKSGRGRRWTVAELKAIRNSWRGDTLADGDGLSGTVRVSDTNATTVHWRYAFKRDGKVAWHYCGTWPNSTLEAIRAARDAAREALRCRVDPNEKREADRVEARERIKAVIAEDERRKAEDVSVESLVREWLKSGVLRKDGNAELIRVFEKDVFPRIGPRAVRALTEQDLRETLGVVVGRGANRLAVTLYRDIRQAFRWAEKRQPWRRLLTEGNPAELLQIETIVDPAYDLSNTRTRVLAEAEIVELQSIFHRMATDYTRATNKRSAHRPVQLTTQHALWISLSTACRMGELLMAQWKHLDLDKATWFIPKENVKGARGKKQDHRVFLSAFALQHFQALHGLTGGTAWCFPSSDKEDHVDVKTVSKQVGDRQHRFKKRALLPGRRNDDSLVLGRGANGEWTPHDLRRTAATMLQALGIAPEVIDRCQNHVLAGSRVRRHYLTHAYDQEKRQAWARLGKALETIFAPETMGSSRGEAVRKNAAAPEGAVPA